MSSTNRHLIKAADNALVSRCLKAIGSKQRQAYLNHPASPEVTLNGTYWDNGYRNTYYVFHTNNGKLTRLPNYAPFQYGGPIGTPIHVLEDCEVMVIHQQMGSRQCVRIISPTRIPVEA